MLEGPRVETCQYPVRKERGVEGEETVMQQRGPKTPAALMRLFSAVHLSVALVPVLGVYVSVALVPVLVSSCRLA
jgi:hypothetical protein